MKQFFLNCLHFWPHVAQRFASYLRAQQLEYARASARNSRAVPLGSEGSALLEMICATAKQDVAQ